MRAFHVLCGTTMSTPQNILVLQFGDLGDTLLTIPAVRAVRETYPTARVVLLAKPLACELFRELGVVDEAIEVSKHLYDRPTSLAKPSAAASVVALVARLRRRRFDTVVVLHHLLSRWGTIKFALLCLATGASSRAGPDNGRGWFLTHKLHDRGFGTVHESQYWLNVAGLIGAHGAADVLLPESFARDQAAGQLLQHYGVQERPVIALHPGTGWYAPGRLWPAARFARVAEHLLNETSGRCLILGTEQDMAAGAEVSAMLGNRAVNLMGATDLHVLAGVLRACDVLVANDGGVAHLAAAMGTPVVSVFGPSNDRAWRPLTGTVVKSDLPCRPCLYRDRETGLRGGCETRECLTAISAERVAHVARAIMRDRQFAG